MKENGSPSSERRAAILYGCRRHVRKTGVVMLAGLAMYALAGRGSPAVASGGGACAPPITAGEATSVTIEDYCFSPTVVHVRPGTTITWINKDVPHTITGANRAWGSYKTLKTSSSASWRFDRAGIYPYYCVLHIGMVGTVVVEEPGATGPAADISRGDVRRVPEQAAARASTVDATDALQATEPDVRAAFVVGGLLAGTVAVGALSRRALRGRRRP